MVTPFEIEEYTAYRREILLREAAADRLARRATASQTSRAGLATALRIVAGRLDRDVRPAATAH